VSPKLNKIKIERLHKSCFSGGVKKYWNSGIRNIGVMDYWNGGIME